MLKVSIITVSFNSAVTIEDTIKSVFSQIYPNIEYIIIDGASTDGTQEIINRYKNRIAYFVSEPDQGIYNAMNKGIARATGDIIGTLNADDTYAHKRVIETVVKYFETSEAECGWGDLVYVKRDNLGKIVRMWISSPYKEGLFEKGWHPPHPAFFVKRETYARHGGYHEQFKIAADYEMALRLLKKYKVKSCYIPETLVKMRVGGISNSHLSGIVLANKESYQAWKINDLPVSPWVIIKKLLSKTKQFFK